MSYFLPQSFGKSRATAGKSVCSKSCLTRKFGFERVETRLHRVWPGDGNETPRHGWCITSHLYAKSGWWDTNHGVGIGWAEDYEFVPVIFLQSLGSTRATAGKSVC
ncbi:hypothetical protein [Siphonobacter sp. SORGH_AS_0500]|uniref:hypothetical protein n=1 Tax=Siphonobacter sp. SORGH_AS_0500 TaxID=1864824 RepID=UPI00285F8E33|nr:hypothetical protein [Siphonobacter sp. SORGH_AS_0500]MDR6197637.1 hypothetical protein [Siphonobacter sp. SORGH_AS_0500]